MNILELGIHYGTVTTINFQTIINKQGDGFEQKIPLWDEPLLSFDIGNKSLDNEEINYLQTFFDARKGSFETFLIKDWSDYYAKNQILSLNNNLDYQLYKTYQVDANAVNRIISKPKIDTVKIFIDGIEQLSGWTVNALTGVVSFSSTPVGIITANFEFYVPVRFLEDKIDYRFQGYEKETNNKIYSLEKLSLQEIKETPTINYINNNQGNYDFTIDLGYDYETLGGEAYSTKINKVTSGFEKRRQNWIGSQGSWDIGQKKLNLAELNHLIAAFRLCKGQFGDFFYKDWKTNKKQLVRFGEDNLSFRFDAIDLKTQQVIFDLSGILLKKEFISNNTYIIPLLDSSGSMSSYFPTINQVLNDFRQTLINNSIYGSEVDLNKYYKTSETFANERYLNIVSQDYRDDPIEENKFKFLIFMNESSLAYHSNPRNSSNEPTSSWLNDYNVLSNLVLNYEYFEVLIINPIDFNSLDTVAFDQHLTDAINGNGNYSNYALNQLGFSYTAIPDFTQENIYEAIFDFFVS